MLTPMSSAALQLVFSTFPNADKARQIGTELVSRQLAACVNLIPSVESIYRWQGQVETATEVLALFKVGVGRYAEFEAALADLHPYEVPEIVAVDVAAVLPAYLEWAVGETS